MLRWRHDILTNHDNNYDHTTTTRTTNTTAINRRNRQNSKKKSDNNSNDKYHDHHHRHHHRCYEYNPLKMYLSCMGIVLCWMGTGTIFYSYCNHWPWPQSFFYAVDAGLSIGFCVTNLYEVNLVSKAFTILYILLGASVFGGVLALLIQDAVQGTLARPSIQEYQVHVDRHAFEKANVDHTGLLSFDQFKQLMIQTTTTTSSVSEPQFSEEDIRELWKGFDRYKDGVIHFKEFVGTCRGIHHLVASLKGEHKAQTKWRRILVRIRLFLGEKLWDAEHRIFVVFFLWLGVGIVWGMYGQGWDIITATHFAVSAMTTGGLTAPSVDENGILPAPAAIFCGIFCFLGVPLFALTLGRYARFLVAGHKQAMEAEALSRPLTPQEYEFVARHLTTQQDDAVHLSDFIVLQLLRQGKLTVEMVQLMKRNFEVLDIDHSGTLTLEQATAPLSPFPFV